MPGNKCYTQGMLHLMPFDKIQHIAKQWHIKRPNPSKTQLISQIYNNLLNQDRNNLITFVDAGSSGTNDQSITTTALHKRRFKQVDSNPKPAKRQRRKQTNNLVTTTNNALSVTKPLQRYDSQTRNVPCPAIRHNFKPYCWFLAGLQLAAMLDWNINLQSSKKDLLAKQLDIIQKMKYRKVAVIAGLDTYKIAGQFIKHINILKTKDIKVGQMQSKEPLWSLNNNEDCAEFLRYFINMSTNQKAERYLNNNLSFVLQRIIHCQECDKHIMRETAPDRLWTLDVTSKQKATSVQNLVDEYTATETINNYKCGTCKIHTKSDIGLKPTKLSRYLLVVLKRYFYDKYQNPRKNMVSIQIDETLCIKTVNGNVKYYKLSAVVNHVGQTTSGGHYTCDKMLGNKIFHCDDDSIEVTSNWDKKQSYVLLFKEISKPDSDTDDSDQDLDMKSSQSPKKKRRTRKKKRNKNNKKRSFNISNTTTTTTSSPKDINCKRRKLNMTQSDVNLKPSQIQSSNVQTSSQPKISSAFEIMNYANFKLPIAAFPKGITKDFVVKLLRKQREKCARLSLREFHNEVKQNISAKYVTNWKKKSVSITFYGKQLNYDILQTKIKHYKYNQSRKGHQRKINYSLTPKGKLSRKKHKIKGKVAAQLDRKSHRAKTTKQQYVKNVKAQYLLLPNQCTHCYKRFHTAQKLNQHIKDAHRASTSVSLWCPYCLESYKNKRALNVHIGMMHGTVPIPYDANYDVTTAVDMPSWQTIKDYRHKKADYGVAGNIKMMSTHIMDPRKKPRLDDTSFTVNKETMMSEWKQSMNHDAAIKTCATCGRQVVMTAGEFVLLSPTSKLLNCCKADVTKLPPKGTERYKALHLVTLNNEIFKLSDRGIINNETVIVCKTCSANLVYSKTSKKPPKNTFAHYDIGKIPYISNNNPNGLRKLTFGEKIAMCRVIVFAPIIQLKPVYGKSHTGIKGHAFGIRCSQENIVNSLVKALPRHDLGDVIQVSLCGTPDMWPIAKKILKQGHLNIRLEAIMPWLSWLKKLGNPQFTNVRIPSTDREQEEIQKMLDKSVEKILENASHTSSGKINALIDNTRCEVSDEQEGLNDDIEENASIIRNTLITSDINIQEPMQSVLEQIKHKISKPNEQLEKNTKIKKTLENELINEYIDNHTLLYQGFPFIFPLGLTVKDMGTATVPKSMQETWMLFYDHRVAEELHLVFFLFDQYKRHSVNKAVAYKIKQSGDREQKFIDMVNQDDFLENLQTAIDHPKSDESRSIKNTISPLVQIIGQTLGWTVFERNSTLGKIYSLTHFFGVPTHFITISPSMRNNIIALRMTLKNGDKITKLPTITARSQMMIQNPVAATYTFYRVIQKFFQIIVKLAMNTFTGKNIDYSELIKKEMSGESGAFGDISAYFGVIEEQKAGNLHLHCLLFGAWNVRKFQLWCHDGQAAELFKQLIDSHITCQIPQSLKISPKDIKPIIEQYLREADEQLPTLADIKSIAHLISVYNNKINLLDPYPEADNVEFEGATFAARYNHHKHSATCWRVGQTKCRLAMPQPQAPKTFFTEICADENGEPKRKYPSSVPGKEIISEPPIRGKNAFSVKDHRVIVSRLSRRDDFEKWQVECSLIATALLRCNTSMQILITESQAKTAAFYIATYMSKNPFQLQSLIPLIKQAEEEFQKYGSSATDKHADDRKAKNMMQKILNKHTLLEISDQQAAAAVMGYDSFVSSHYFDFVEPWQAVHRHQASYESVEEEEEIDNDKDITVTNLEYDVKAKKAVTISNVDRYLSRGVILQKYCLYIYTLSFRHQLLGKKKGKKIRRPANPTFAFEANSKASKCFEQILRSRPIIARISGKPPPAYPGDKPCTGSTQSKLTAWINNAKTFVEFYSLLFLPVQKEKFINLIPPYDNILPWNDKSSWDNFWNVFNNFENSSSFYNRAIWCIFQNMVDNMRQHKDERTLVSKFRFSAADIINNTVLNEAASNKRSKKSAHKHTEEMSEDENDLEALQIIIDQIRDKYGSDKFLSAKQIERKKAKAYIDKQINIYHELQQTDIRAAKQLRRYRRYTYEQCKKERKQFSTDAAKIPNTTVEFGSTDNIIVDFDEKKKKIKLKPFQEKTVEQLKRIKMNTTATDDIKEGQLLAIIQGVPGAGKTTTAKTLGEKLGLGTVCAGTTGTAAAQLKTETINTLLGLGLNLPNFTKNDIHPTTKQMIIETFENVDLLIIDEVSMLTPVTLTKISTFLRLALECDYLFGGLSVLLIGDMYQFPPIQKGLSKPALYQAAVMLGLGLTMPNNAYRVGAEIFTKFRMVIMDGQVRATPEFDRWLGQLRNLDVEYPITDPWLSQLTTLSKEDFQSKSRNWNEQILATSGNIERWSFIAEKIKIFGKQNSQPILRWVCPLKVGKNQYEAPGFNPEGVYDELIKYYVYKAKCVLTKNLETKLGLGKGSEGVYHDIVWKDPEQAIDIQQLAVGEITQVTQPDYIVIKFGKRFIPIIAKAAHFEDANKKKRTYMAHQCDLSAAVTFHKVQAKTVEAIILSLNSTSSISKKINNITLSSIYVGSSRVKNHQDLRVLPLTHKDKEYLKTLKWDPYLRKFFNNYDQTGRWIPNGLKKDREDFVNAVKMQLGMIELSALTVEEMKKFVRQLDLIMPQQGKVTKKEYITTLTTSHAQGQKLLNANEKHLLKVHRLELTQQLHKENLQTLKLKKLRYYAKRLGIQQCSQSQLQEELQTLLDQTVCYTQTGQHTKSEQKRSDNREMDISDLEEESDSDPDVDIELHTKTAQKSSDKREMDMSDLENESDSEQDIDIEIESVVVQRKQEIYGPHPTEPQTILEEIEQADDEDSDMDVVQHDPNDSYCMCPQCMNIPRNVTESEKKNLTDWDSNDDVDINDLSFEYRID